MNTATRPLNLSYDLLPPPTSQEVERYNIATQRRAEAFTPPPGGVRLAEQGDHRVPAYGRTWHHPTVKQLRLFMVAWSVLAMAYFVSNNDTTMAAILVPYNIFAYLIIRWAQVPKRAALVASGLLGLIFLLLFSTGVNSAVLTLVLLFTLAISAQHLSRGSSPRGMPMATPQWAKQPGSPNAAYYADIPTSLQATWGLAGAHIASNTQFGDAGRRGARGEAIVGEALNNWALRYPHVRVFHGLCFTPGKPGPDVDHAVLINDRLFLIDAKYWGKAGYSWGRARGEDGNVVLKNGVHFSGSSVHMDAAREKWSRYMPGGISVVARICAVSEGGKARGYSMNNSGAPRGVSLTDLDNLTRELDIAARNGSQKFLNRYAVKAVASQLQ